MLSPVMASLHTNPHGRSAWTRCGHVLPGTARGLPSARSDTPHIVSVGHTAPSPFVGFPSAPWMCPNRGGRTASSLCNVIELASTAQPRTPSCCRHLVQNWSRRLPTPTPEELPSLRYSRPAGPQTTRTDVTTGWFPVRLADKLGRMVVNGLKWENTAGVRWLVKPSDTFPVQRSYS